MLPRVRLGLMLSLGSRRLAYLLPDLAESYFNHPKLLLQLKQLEVNISPFKVNDIYSANL
jgi:hypothetical protein